jgi:hypothetical protein
MQVDRLKRITRLVSDGHRFDNPVRQGLPTRTKPLARPADLPNDAMTKKEIEEFRRGLSLLSPYAVREKYKQVVDCCRLM